MKTIIMLLTMAALLAQVNFNATAQEVSIPIPVTQAGQYDGGVRVAAEPIEGVELYYFWRDGAMVSISTEPEFIDYPSWGAIYNYQVQVSVDWVRGELSSPATVDLSDPCFPNGCPCNPCDPFAWCFDPYTVCEENQ